MVGVTSVPDLDRYDVINQFGDVFAYYVDEPAEKDNSMAYVKSSIDALNLNSLFIISGYRRTNEMVSYVSFADKVMFSAYHHWWECFPNVWCDRPPYSDDQRPDWTDMRFRFSNKFSLTWINSTEISEFNVLFAHAQYLGLTGVWVYTLDGHQTDQFYNISLSAFDNGFLRQKQREYRIEWRCDNPNPCQNCNPADPDDWYIDAVIETSNYRIIEN